MKKTIAWKAPDGGYGWIIVLAASLNGFIAVMSGFGLILVDSFEDLDLSATQGSFIINLNAGFGMLAGIMNGPLLNKFGYRKIALVGAFFMSVGIFLLTFAENVTGFILAYGLMASVGVALSRSSYSLVISTYFTEKRNKAFAITMTVAGLGPILLPQVLDMLLEYFGTKGAILILSSIYAQTFVAACLLQPVQFHVKEAAFVKQKATLPKIEEEDEADSAIGEDHESLHDIPKITRSRFLRVRSNSYVSPLEFRRKDSIISINYEQEIAGIYGLDSTVMGASVMSLEPGALPTLDKQQTTKTKFQWWRSASTVNLESCVDIFEAEPKEERRGREKTSAEIEPATGWRRFLAFVVKIFDLTLLKDYTYCSIMVGIALTVFAETDFSLSLPFMLSEFGMTTTEIAEFLSIVGVADIIFRFLSSYIGDFLNKPPRIMHLISLMGLIVVRTRWLKMFAETDFSLSLPFMLSEFGMTTTEIAEFLSIVGVADIIFRFLSSYIGDFLNKPPRIMHLISLMGLIVVRTLISITSEVDYLFALAVALGAAKGIRTVYLSLTIPSYVPLDRLASASGIQMVFNGLFVVGGGTFLVITNNHGCRSLSEPYKVLGAKFSSCRNSRNRNPKLSFHTFPKRNISLVGNITESGLKEKIDRYKAWKIELKLHKSPPREALVCYLHFKRDDFLLPGYVRDTTGDYKGGIVFLNLVTFSVVIMWTVELIFTRKKSDEKPENQEQNQEETEVLSQQEVGL